MLNIVQNISENNNGGEVKDYNMQIIQDKLNEVGVEEAKEWLHYQALITLMYSVEEREEMLKRKNIN
ncbi:hypothetical protein HYO65_gp217 [Tenacibaculum phage PTm1]|uniref:Uncharacterized protein n=2 Tax=Shirahamavirus PTm1 TaxID=2846435 RepID=A0A5S9EQS2_9CAUD|nr:hypothetical protein HYO65_gp217 [Tenacibaculum phage PTm1]BBI90609.1 hypothetical protein [Tenacibaculum phage PTm1]BBI90915.1 hypothetical protein [Tenacibaculum phage PTm5]